MKLIKGVLAVALALLPIKAMAEDTINIGLFNRDAAIMPPNAKTFSSRKIFASRSTRSPTRRRCCAI